MKKILVVVDYQNDFVDGSLGFVKAKALENDIYLTVKKALADGTQVFFTLDTHTDSYPDTREGKHLPTLHCKDESEGHRLYGKLSEFYNDKRVVMVKKSGFASTNLPDIIKTVTGTPDIIEMCGVVTNMCVLSNAIVLQSEFENTDIRILSDMCASFDEDLHQKAIDIMRNIHMTIL